MENNHMKLSQSLEDYLEMVHMLRLANGIARVKDIAAALSVKMPSVAKAILELKKLGLVTQEPYSGVELTEAGRKAAADVLNRHILLKGFLIRLGVSEAIADKDACSMEHILSAETLSTIEDFMKKGSEGVVAKKVKKGK
ncbi:MAG: DtxR family transcriptional regulator [Fibrobacter sp.]|nr:DtxR family transcriptional regulator [Fibrobacter sp.]